MILTLKAPITTAEDDIHKYFLFVFVFFREIRLYVSSESSARQGIHLKHQASFSSKDKSKNLKCRLLQYLFGSLRVNLLVSGVLKLWQTLPFLLDMLRVLNYLSIYIQTFDEIKLDYISASYANL